MIREHEQLMHRDKRCDHSLVFSAIPIFFLVFYTCMSINCYKNLMPDTQNL